MRILGLLLVLTACTSRPTLHGEGSTPKPITDAPPPTAGCHEISRSRCDTAHCKGSGLDYVVLACPSGQVERCEKSKTDCQ